MSLVKISTTLVTATLLALKSLVFALLKVSLITCPHSLPMPMQLQHANKTHNVSALLESGSAVNLIHCKLMEDLYLPTIPYIMPL